METLEAWLQWWNKFKDMDQSHAVFILVLSFKIIQGEFSNNLQPIIYQIIMCWYTVGVNKMEQDFGMVEILGV